MSTNPSEQCFFFIEIITAYGNKCGMLGPSDLIDVLLHHAAIAFPLNKRLDINVKPYIMLEAIYV